MTKEDIGDLKIHVDLVVQRERAALNAELALEQARSNLETFLHYQQFPEQKRK